MRIWLINPFDELPGEGPEQRYAALARTLLQQGHDVLWVSCAFRHRTKMHIPAGLHRREMSLKKSIGKAPELRICLIPAPGYQANLSLQRLWSHQRWAGRMVRELKQRVNIGELETPDCLIASTPPLEGAQAAIRLGRSFGAKVTVDFMDDWPRTWLQALPEVSAIQLAGRTLLCPWQRAAARVMRNADTVSAQSEHFARRSKELGHRNEVHVCYLGERALPSTSSPPETGSVFTVLYLGAMGRIYDLESALQAAKQAKERGDSWNWILAGSDPDHAWENRSKQLGLGSCVTFPGYVSDEALGDILRRANLGLVPMDPRSGVAVPYKACHYLSAGLPLVSTLPGELEELLHTFGAGVTIPHRNAEALFEAVSSYAADSGKLARARQGAQDLFAAKFERDLIYPRWAEWISNYSPGSLSL